MREKYKIQYSNNSAQMHQKKIPPKNELLDWLNSILKASGHHTDKIQNLGTGVAYLLLISYLHPGVLTHTKYNKKPNNQYEYHINLKILASTFAKLNIEKHVDIQKLGKLRMQDNLAMLQWFYNYASEQLTKQVKDRAFQQQKDNKEEQNKKKPKIKVGQKLNLVLPEKSTKMDIEESTQMQLKTVSSATKKIHQIQEVLHKKDCSTNQAKLQKIMSILKINEARQPSILTPVGNRRAMQSRHKNSMQQIIDENVHEENIPKQKKQITYVKCRKLQQKYQQYIKNSLLKKPQTPHTNPFSNPKSSRPSVKLSSQNQIFEYNTNLYPQIEQNQMRRTDNSILLQSDRKSVQSQTNLLQEQ